MCVCLKPCRTQSWDLTLKTSQCHDILGGWENWLKAAGVSFMLDIKISCLCCYMPHLTIPTWVAFKGICLLCFCFFKNIHFSKSCAKSHPCLWWTATFLQCRKTEQAWGLVKGSLSTQFCNSHISQLPDVEFRQTDLVTWCCCIWLVDIDMFRIKKENQWPGQSIKVLLKEVIQLPVSVVCRDYTNVLMAFRACWMGSDPALVRMGPGCTLVYMDHISVKCPHLIMWGRVRGEVGIWARAWSDTNTRGKHAVVSA